ncbi:Serine-threonine/tyrosine-protein kinase, catalytic domain [Sesbania bispinosa]|nr:Serine-threonine/tyrosine-protein kinase, catalytic domain [Sesbania bispinosa]
MNVTDNMKREGACPWIVTLMLNVCVWLALLPLCITHVNSELDKPVARDIVNDKHPGFISIDCGSKTDYFDSDIGIWYQSDKEFVKTGTNHLISLTKDLNYLYFGRRLNTLRYFPEGERNCYRLKPEQGKNNSYLIRAFFAYGNYDGKNQTQSFELHLGVNRWENVSVGLSGYSFAEVIHTPSSDSIDVCLVKTGPTIPFISSLELRPLNNSIYQNHEIMSSTDPQPLLRLEVRVDAGSPQLPPPDYNKYKDDVYDRMWRCDPNYNESGWYPLELEEESIDIGPGSNGDAYKLPGQVLRSAAVANSSDFPLEFDYDTVFDEPLDRPFEYLVYFHFAEIQKLPDGEKRIIGITLNSKPVLSQPLELEYLKPVTLNYSTQGDVWFSISATSQSDAPPILNAYEIYQLITELSSSTDTQDVSAIEDIKSTYQISRLNWQGDPCLPNQYAWEGLICSSADTNPSPRITSLNLSSSNLAGQITTSFSYLTELEFLDLSHNDLEGPLPEFLAELPKLKVLNLTGNKLSGPIPKPLKEKADTTLQLSVADNPDLCMTDPCKKKNFVVPLVVASLSALILILFISLAFWIYRRRKVVRSDSKKGGSLKSKLQAFSYNEILNITDNFKTTIGEGGFGRVYFGILQDHTQVAVKLLSRSSMQGYKEFRSEAQLLMKTHHRNLVSLIGYCDEGEIKALIYEYMANGNLQQHLSVDNPNVLNWNKRLNIAVDAAQGLDYLHNGCTPPLIHRDLKTANILLDHNMNAKIADFGLSRAFGNDIDSHVSTRPAGTLGYVDPEFQRTGNSNKKCDIYSFGIILFELITGQKALVRAPGKNINMHILEWVIPIVERGDIQDIVDGRLKGEFSINSAWKAVEIAMSCTSTTAAVRPDISQILVDLKECISLEMVHKNRESARTTIELTTSVQIDLETAPFAR